MNKSLMALLATLVAGSVSAGVIVPDLNDGTAIYDSVLTETVTAPNPTLGNGITFAAQITASAADLTASSAGTVNIIEIGGTLKGSGLMIKDGDYIFVTKNGVNTDSPTLEDTDGSDMMLGITLGSAQAGVDSKVWVSFDPVNDVVRYSLNGLVTEQALTSVADDWNWVGNRTLSFGTPDSSNGFRAGLSDLGEYGSEPYPADNFAAALSQSFSGTVTRGQFFNEVSSIPEPSTLGFIAFTGIGLLSIRRLMV